MLSAPVRPADAGLEQLPSGLRRTSQRPPPVWTLEPAPRVSVLGCRNQVPQNGVCACGGGAGGGLLPRGSRGQRVEVKESHPHLHLTSALPLAASGGSPRPRAQGRTPPRSACHPRAALPMSVSPLGKDAGHIGSRSPPASGTASSVLTTSVKTPFPSVATT